MSNVQIHSFIHSICFDIFLKIPIMLDNFFSIFSIALVFPLFSSFLTFDTDGSPFFFEYFRFGFCFPSTCSDETSAALLSTSKSFGLSSCTIDGLEARYVVMSTMGI